MRAAAAATISRARATVASHSRAIAAARSSDADCHTAGTRLVLKRACVYASDAERREKPPPAITTAVPPELGPRDGASSSRRSAPW